MQDSNEHLILDCDTNSQTAPEHSDDTTQMVTRSTSSAMTDKEPDTLDAEQDCGDTQHLTEVTANRPADAASERSAVNDLNKTLSEFAQIDMSDWDAGQATHQNPVNANEFQRSQRADPSLTSLWTRAEAGSNEYRVINDMLYRVSPANNSGTEEFLLVVPVQYRTQLLRLAHDGKCSGHLGAHKTEQRLKALFHWPKMQPMIRNYVRSCAQCQMVAAKQNRDRQPLQPIKVMATHAFDDISVDVMGGQLPVTAKGNKYILLIVCNASKWVHGVPLRNLRAETIADKLVEYFCQYGIARIVRSDNFSTFHSQLITKVREKLGVDAKFSAPFHYQSHGSIERVNLSVENMLRKFIQENPKKMG